MAGNVQGKGRPWTAALVAMTALGTTLGGCAGGGGGDPGARPLAAGQSCQSVQAELNRMVNNGVQNSVEAQSAGRKLSAQQKSDADRYNTLLGEYLGARCHVA